MAVDDQFTAMMPADDSRAVTSVKVVCDQNRVLKERTTTANRSRLESAYEISLSCFGSAVPAQQFRGSAFANEFVW